MNDALRTTHLDNITDTQARQMYDELCAACDQREGGMTDADQHIVADIAYMQQMKNLLRADIDEHGTREKFKNGRQEMWRENKSVTQLRSYMEQQRKHLSELRLTASSRKAVPIVVDDEFNDF